jgi:hypothetical protein
MHTRERVEEWGSGGVGEMLESFSLSPSLPLSFSLFLPLLLKTTIAISLIAENTALCFPSSSLG